MSGSTCYTLSLLLVPFCMACTTLTGSWIEPESQELAARSEWRLQEIAVESLDHKEQIKANAAAIYRQLLMQRPAATESDSTMQLQVLIRETTSERDFEHYHTILIESELTNSTGQMIGRGLYIVEAREGLESAHLLYRVVRASLEELR